MLDPADVCWLMDSRERTGSTSSVSRAAHRAGSARTPSKRLARDFLRPDWCPSLDADAGDGDIGAHSEAMSPRPSRCFDEAGLDIKFVEARVGWQL